MSQTFLSQVESTLKKNAEEHNERQWHSVVVDTPCLSTNGLRLPGVTFVYDSAIRHWQVIIRGIQRGTLLKSSLAEAWEEAVGVVMGLKHCDACDAITKCNEQCLPCAVRKVEGTKECGVCCEPKHNFYTLRCGHFFCKECVKRTQPRRCPLCRQKYRINEGLEEESGCACGEEQEMSDEE